MIVNMRWAMIVAVLLPALTGCLHRQVPVGDTARPPEPPSKFHVAIPAHWQVVLSLDTGQTKLDTYVPEGQSREHWTEMLSVVVYDRSVYADLSDVGQRLASTYQRICNIPAIVAQPDTTNENGYNTSLQIARCGKGPGGYAQFVIQKAIDGRDGIYMVKRAWRLPPVADSNNVVVPEVEMKAAAAALNAVHLCDAAQQATACPGAGDAPPTPR